MAPIKSRFRDLVGDLSADEKVRRMDAYTQHGSVSTYRHGMRVAYASLAIARGLGLRTDEEAMVRGAVLHDYFLYDWHEPGHSTHATGHAALAADNARRDFAISDHEYDIIRTHMWPLSPTQVPATREARIVCFADKLCSLGETLFHRG